MTGQALILQANALELPLADASVDLAITSPPFYALRAYGAGPGEIGSEATPAEFLESLWAVTREIVRVLKPSGSIFVNLGDKYNSSSHHMNGISSNADPAKWGRAAEETNKVGRLPLLPEIPPKSLMGLPWRYALGCIDGKAGDALILRAEMIWSKPNGLLPESITDRVRRSHEQWFHFTISPRYYSATDEVREPQKYPDDTDREYQHGRTGRQDYGDMGDRGFFGTGTKQRALNPLGKLPGSVWTIPSEPLRLPDHLGVQHYAAFPSEWPRRLILGWSPPGICVECGQGRVPVVDRREVPHWKGGTKGARNFTPNGSAEGRETEPRTNTEATILGYACACTPFTDHPERAQGRGFIPDPSDKTAGASANGSERNKAYRESLQNPPRPVREYHLDGWKPPPTRPAIVLDPFAGTGTTPMVARALGRIGIGVDLSHPYCRAARWRVAHDGAKAVSRTNLERQQTLDLTAGPTLADLDRQRAELERWRERHDGVNALGGWAAP